MSNQPDISTNESIEQLFSDAIQQRAHDIHLEAYQHDARIRFRVDGILTTYKTLSHEEYYALTDEIKEIASIDRTEKGSQGARFLKSINGVEVDILVSIMTLSHLGQSLVMRIIQQDLFSNFTLKRCGLSPEQMQQFRRWYNRSSGIVLINGPTGSGKTTLLYSILGELDSETLKIISIEDPIEYPIPGVSQFAINPRIGVTFENSMRASLRQAPDVISIGEIRSHEMAIIAVQMALTGHLVLSTMHTTQATKGVIRLKDIGVEPFLIADTLTGICSLRLVRKLCPHCREAHFLDDPVMKNAGFTDGNYFQPKGCDHCNQTGYHGRTGVFEFFEMTDNCRELFLNGCSPSELREQAIKDGMQTMLMDGMRKASEGITSPQEILRILADT